jgi:cystathionine gamma-synthase
MDKEEFNKKGIATNLIHSSNISHDSGAVMSPIILSTTFERGEDGISFRDNYLYSRYDNPNRRSLEQKLIELEHGVACITFSSGLSAATSIFHSLKSGDHIIMPDDCYFGVIKILNKLYSHWGLTYSLVDMTNLESLEKAFTTRTKIVWIESPSNPSLKVTDIEKVVSIAKTKNCITVMDNTWATPYFINPLNFGVNIVLHSTTKYLGGHSDILGGALIFAEENNTYNFIKEYQKLAGPCPSPFDCWLLCRSLSTFAARMPIHATNAIGLASYLENHSKVEKVLYPGLVSHPQHEVAKKQMTKGFGGMLSILIGGGQEEAIVVTQRLKLFKHATSLGGVESLIEHRKSVEGIESKTPDNLLRVSVGIENLEDLINDFKQALK